MVWSSAISIKERGCSSKEIYELMGDDVEALKTALYSTPYRNIKMKLLPILYEKNAFSVQEYLLFLQQPSLSIMDFAIFALKKQNFDFIDFLSNYF